MRFVTLTECHPLEVQRGTVRTLLMIRICHHWGKSLTAEMHCYVPLSHDDVMTWKRFHVTALLWKEFNRGAQKRHQVISNYHAVLQWRHNESDGVSNHRHIDCLRNRLFRRRSKKRSNLRTTGLCDGNSPVTREFPAERSINAENVSIWWRHHGTRLWWQCLKAMLRSMHTTL